MGRKDRFDREWKAMGAQVGEMLAQRSEDAPIVPGYAIVRALGERIRLLLARTDDVKGLMKLSLSSAWLWSEFRSELEAGLVQNHTFEALLNLQSNPHEQWDDRAYELTKAIYKWDQ